MLNYKNKKIKNQDVFFFIDLSQSFLNYNFLKYIYNFCLKKIFVNFIKKEN